MKKGEKRQMAQILSGSILRKYKVKSIALKICGVDTRNHLKTRTCLSKRLCKNVRDFFERDDISRLTTGMKQTVTQKRMKKQRRILNDTLANLHLKYLSESNQTKIRYTTFCKLRPFWIVFPTESDRNTCLCKMCENTQFMSTAVKKIDAMKMDNLEAIVEKVVCSITNKDCMFGDCNKCKTKTLYKFVNKDDLDQEVEWFE